MRKNKKDIKWFFAMGKPWYMKWWLWLCMFIIVLSIPIIINSTFQPLYRERMLDFSNNFNGSIGLLTLK